MGHEGEGQGKPQIFPDLMEQVKSPFALLTKPGFVIQPHPPLEILQTCCHFLATGPFDRLSMSSAWIPVGCYRNAQWECQHSSQNSSIPETLLNLGHSCPISFWICGLPFPL